ncbi:serine hydrolase [Candidatus Sumerlaeota bacterium]|nr:serine hydrolase [Candidatus Sumerlaeota bacterium]
MFAFNRFFSISILLFVLILSLSCSKNNFDSSPYLPLGSDSPENLEINPNILQKIDVIVEEAIRNNDAPGAVALIGKDNKIAFFKSYGNRRIRPYLDPMTKDTIFDLASCSKILGTSTMTMLLLEDGKITLQTKVADILPQFAQNGKGDVTIWNLLTHTSGLPPYCDWKEADNKRGNKTQADALIDYICSLGKRYPTGEFTLYSCLNYLTLARVNETVAGESMHDFLKKRVWNPLHLESSGYFLTEEQLKRTAPTSKGDTVTGVGIVHDPLARYHTATPEHCPGNAGLFMSSHDMAVMAQMILNKGRYNNVRIFKPETIDLWTSLQITLSTYDSQKKPDFKGEITRRCLGWICYMEPPYTVPNAPDASFIGHTGWTGTYIWIDKNSKTFLIFNTNTVHPDGEPKIHPYRKRITETLLKSLKLYQM